MKLRLQFTGVGGQGVLTGANILAQAFLAKDEHVLMSEVHGMAQRGRSVVCTVCAGAVKSPLIADGTADAGAGWEFRGGTQAAIPPVKPDLFSYQPVYQHNRSGTTVGCFP